MSFLYAHCIFNRTWINSKNICLFILKIERINVHSFLYIMNLLIAWNYFIFFIALLLFIFYLKLFIIFQRLLLLFILFQGIWNNQFFKSFFFIIIIVILLVFYYLLIKRLKELIVFKFIFKLILIKTFRFYLISAWINL